MSRVLWVTDEPPDHGRGGGSIRQAHLLTRVAEHHDVTLVCCSPVPDDAVRDAVDRLVHAPVTGSRRSRFTASLSRYPIDVATGTHIRRALSRAVDALEGAHDVVLVEHAWVVPILPRRRQIPWVGTLHYLPSARAEHWSAVAADPARRALRRLDVVRAHRFERWALRGYDQLLVVSDDDAAALGGGTVIPNGVDLAAFTPAPLPAEPRLVMTASWNYGPNMDGLRWFLHDVLPHVRAVRPDVELAVVGRRPGDDVRSWCEAAGAALHADVPSVVPYMHQARVAVVPLRVGSGTRLKALEAMATGRALAGTSIGLEGLGLIDGHDARSADDPTGLARAIVELLDVDGPAQDIATRGQQRAQESFGWDAIGAKLIDELSRMTEQRR